MFKNKKGEENTIPKDSDAFPVIFVSVVSAGVSEVSQPSTRWADAFKDVGTFCAHRFASDL